MDPKFLLTYNFFPTPNLFLTLNLSKKFQTQNFNKNIVFWTLIFFYHILLDNFFFKPQIFFTTNFCGPHFFGKLTFLASIFSNLKYFQTQNCFAPKNLWLTQNCFPTQNILWTQKFFLTHNSYGPNIYMVQQSFFYLIFFGTWILQLETIDKAFSNCL